MLETEIKEPTKKMTMEEAEDLRKRCEAILDFLATFYFNNPNTD